MNSEIYRIYVIRKLEWNSAAREKDGKRVFNFKRNYDFLQISTSMSHSGLHPHLFNWLNVKDSSKKKLSQETRPHKKG